MAPRGKVALFVCPSTPFFLDTLGLRHGDLKESAQKSYVLYQDFEFNHLSKRKRASPAHVSFKNVHCFSILGFLSCLVHLALIVKINENYIKIHINQFFKKWTKDLNKQFNKEKIQMINEYTQMLSIISHQRKAK